MKLRIDKIHVRNFRSISNLKIDISKFGFIVICGANNVGKTNFLRALNLFFNQDPDPFDPEVDIPHHISKGARGGGFYTKIKVDFTDVENNDKYTIESKYTFKKDIGIINETKGKKNESTIDGEEIKNVLSNIKFIFIKSINEDIPHLVSNLVIDEILPLGLERRRGKKNSMKALDKFIELSQKTVNSMENDLTKEFKKFMGENELDSKIIDISNYKIKVTFPNYKTLSEAIENLVGLTLVDTNDSPLEQKGGGIQRMILLSLLKYMLDHTKDTVVWAIDEPEVNLQPALQKILFAKLKELAEENQIIATSHSPHFVDLSMIENTILFIDKPEIKKYVRRPSTKYINPNTTVSPLKGFEKIEAVKTHLGIERNDSWSILPFNLIVEGSTDRDYLTYFAKIFNLTPPNIIIAGGASKMPGSLRFIKNYCKELNFRPYIRCILDHDNEGKKTNETLKKFKSNPSLPFDLDLVFVKKSNGQFDDKWNFCMEDMLYKDLLFNSINKILRKKKYNTIIKYQRNNWSEPAYQNNPILQYASECIRQRNTDKEAININSEDFKPWICKNICSTNIVKKDLDRYHTKEPDVKQHITEILTHRGL